MRIFLCVFPICLSVKTLREKMLNKLFSIEIQMTILKQIEFNEVNARNGCVNIQ